MPCGYSRPERSHDRHPWTLEQGAQAKRTRTSRSVLFSAFPTPTRINSDGHRATVSTQISRVQSAHPSGPALSATQLPSPQRVSFLPSSPLAWGELCRRTETRTVTLSPPRKLYTTDSTPRSASNLTVSPGPAIRPIPMVAAIAPTHLGRKAEGKAFRPRKADRREIRFAQLIAQGQTQWRAYEAISGAKKRETCEVQGHRWCLRPAVQLEIIRQRALLTEETAMSRAEKRNHLANVARREDTPPSVIVSAVAVDNRMTGDDEPFRKAAGDDLRVQFFVLRIGEDNTRAQLEQSAAQSLPGSPGDPASEAINVTPAPAEPAT